jgi:hypothetical protein
MFSYGLSFALLLAGLLAITQVRPTSGKMGNHPSKQLSELMHRNVK